MDELKRNLESVTDLMTNNISFIVARQEAALCHAVILHNAVDVEIDNQITTLIACRQAAHDAIEAKTEIELDGLQEYLDALEKSLNICLKEISELVKTQDSPSVNVDGTIKAVSSCFSMTTRTGTLTRLKEHIDILRCNFIHDKKTPVGPVMLNTTRCDELKLFLSKGYLISVDNKPVWCGPVCHKDDAILMLVGFFERLGICEDCLECAGNESLEKSIHKTCLCGEVSGLRARSFSTQHTINRDAGEINGSFAGGLLKRPTGVALISTTSDTLLFVNDSRNHRIQVYNSETGQFLRTIGNGKGSALGQFNYPQHLLSMAQTDISPSLLCVSDWYNNRVQIIDVNQGDVVTNSINVAHPSGLADLKCQANLNIVHYLYVSEYFNHQVILFDMDTLKPMRVIGEQGAGAGQLLHPLGLATLVLSVPMSDLTQSRLFVCDEGNHRVQVFDALTGSFHSTIGVKLFSSPMGAAISSSNNIHTQHTLIISDFNLRKLFLFDAISGECESSIGSRGAHIRQFDGPIDLVASRNDNDHIIIFVAEVHNNRVQIVVA